MPCESRAKQVVKKALKALGKDKIYLEIYFAGNQEMKFLNKKFRGKNKSANILSFKEPENFPHPELWGAASGNRKKGEKLKQIGEMYLNLTDDKRQAVSDKRGAVAIGCHLSVVSRQLLIHGLLHLLGYTHNKKSDTIKMKKMEQLVMRTLKFYK
ncbi:rRNA maturation RNase YbeY [Candidatus Wolfebacteria bacterium]|nr:rRNA maturation RNase YbeY [Candidatus Wolfebacteria bacterium]